MLGEDEEDRIPVRSWIKVPRPNSIPEGDAEEIQYAPNGDLYSIFLDKRSNSYGRYLLKYD